MTTEEELEDTYREMGYSAWVAEALAGREIKPGRLGYMSTEEVLDEVLIWHGIQGYTSQILGTVLHLIRQKGR